MKSFETGSYELCMACQTLSVRRKGMGMGRLAGK